VGQSLLIILHLRSNLFRQATLGRTSLDEWSAWRRDLYLTTHTNQKRQIDREREKETSLPLPGGIRNHNPSKRSAADRLHRPCGQLWLAGGKLMNPFSNVLQLRYLPYKSRLRSIMDIEKRETVYSVAYNSLVSLALLLFLPLPTTPAPHLISDTFYF
jgi:hypothetical protein